MEEVLSEATSKPVTKKNLITRIMETIKKIFTWIAKQWNRFTNWVKNLFKRKTQSVDAIVDEVFKSPSNNQSIKSQKTLISANDKSLESNKSVSEQKSISIPFNPIVGDDKTDHTENITLAYKDLQCKIDGSSFLFRVNYVQDSNMVNRGRNAVPGHAPLNNSWNAIVFTFDMIINPDKLNLLKDIISSLNAKEYEGGIFNETQFVNKVNKFKQYWNTGASVPNKFVADIKNIEEVNKVIQDIHKALSFYDDPSIIPGENSVIVREALNFIADVSWRFQFGINAITTCMNHIYEIDAKYAEMIDNNEDLSKFVEGCITGNVPPKYIAWNTFAICSKRMRGNADQRRPKMGQTRLALFPLNEPVAIKVALSQYGVRSNNAEAMVFDAFKKNNSDHLLTRVENISKNKCVISMELVDTDTVDRHDSSHQKKYDKLLDDIHDARINAGLKISLTDIHWGNIGIRKNGEFVATDYGFTER